MTTRPKASEQYPTAELRNWRYRPQDNMVHGSFYYHIELADGTYGTVINIVSINRYSDHNFFVTKGGEYFKAFLTEQYLNGG